MKTAVPQYVKNPKDALRQQKSKEKKARAKMETILGDSRVVRLYFPIRDSYHVWHGEEKFSRSSVNGWERRGWIRKKTTDGSFRIYEVCG